ncbi:trans-aconitate methyltransferase [Paenibacillus mucilaginosus]|uniref:class I SAM-dependent methyltransferase n=1 Tax=Paenibacillus mucilaginosus TaxID=61624 RepID=UPI003D1BD426
MERKHTFNKVTREYERYRPRYPKELFEEIAASNSVTPTSPILEIGCGTGQATGGLVESGFDRITCIELGEKLDATVREKFRHSPNVQVVHAAFEEWQAGITRYDLAVSATAFHFVQPQELGYRKVYDLLHEGGSIGRMRKYP